MFPSQYPTSSSTSNFQSYATPLFPIYSTGRVPSTINYQSN